MSLDLDSLCVREDVCMAYANWALESGIWDGRPISWMEGSDFTEEMEARIAALLGSQDPESIALYKVAANLALMGASPEERNLLNEDIREYGLTDQGIIIQAGHGKSFKKFWQKHKVAILIGVGVVAVVTAVAIVALCSAGAATAGAAAGGAALGAANDRKNEPKSKASRKKVEANPVPEKKVEVPYAPTPVPGKMVFVENGVLLDGQYLTYNEVMERARFENFLAAPMQGERLSSEFSPANPMREDSFAFPSQENQSWFSWAMKTIGHEVAEGDSGIAFEKLSFPPSSDEISDETRLGWAMRVIGHEVAEGDSDTGYMKPYDSLPPSSTYFTTEGVHLPHLRIGGINGINTSLWAANSHANYLSKFTPKHSVDWVHNHSNGVVMDIAESLLVNYSGISINTGNLLSENWIDFHEVNKDNPHAKYLQFCHSQGAIHVRNELLKMPEEIRKRIVVVAIAPAAIVTDDLCHQSFNYASKSDLIYLGELVYGKLADQNMDEGTEFALAALERQTQLILLDPHPNATGIDHDFQSPTFLEIIANHIRDYIESNGTYL